MILVDCQQIELKSHRDHETRDSCRSPQRQRAVVGQTAAHANGAPFGAPPPCHVKSELPSVHLFSAGQSVNSPASARLPRLVARGYTGLLP
jgi:hypothetical protein